MTKTEQTIMARIALSRRGRTVVMYGYRTGRSVRRYGLREHAALCSLRERGLIRIVSSDDYRDCRSQYSDHWNEVVIEKVV